MRAAWALLLLLAAGCGGPANAPETSTTPHPTGIGFERIAEDFQKPLLALADPEGRLVVVEQTGRAVRLDGETRTVVLDVRAKLPPRPANEQGLLGLAYHEGVMLASYSDREGDTVLARYFLDDGVADVAREEILLHVAQPQGNHNGGHVVVGPDGMVYMGLGDGGGAGDPNLNGQNRNTLLGSMLRLQVGASGPYRVPADNPFTDEAGARGEIWAYGLRNPWRFSFDAATGDLWIGDVGQNAYEEIDHQPAASAGGQNYGWNVYEGRHHFPSGADAPPAGTVFPVAEYRHDDFGGGHCSVTGGHVVHDPGLPALDGLYVFGDYCSGTVWRMAGPGGTPAVVATTGFRISSFGSDGDGHLLIVDHQGAVHRAVAG